MIMHLFKSNIIMHLFKSNIIMHLFKSNNSSRSWVFFYTLAGSCMFEQFVLEPNSASFK